MKKLIIPILILLFAIDLNAQSFTILSPSISVRTANLPSYPYDFQYAMTVYDFNGKNKLYFEVEREIGRPHRTVDYRLEILGAYTTYFEKTSRNINNLEVGYLYKREGIPARAGFVFIYDHFGKINKCAQFEVKLASIYCRKVWSTRKNIWEGRIDWGIPISKEAVSLGRFKLILGFQTLAKFYIDESSEYWQIKFGLLLKVSY